MGILDGWFTTGADHILPGFYLLSSFRSTPKRVLSLPLVLRLSLCYCFFSSLPVVYLTATTYIETQSRLRGSIEPIIEGLAAAIDALYVVA